MSEYWEPPFNNGDRVVVGKMDGLTVRWCWNRWGNWQVYARGPETKSNPRGRYTFAAADAIKAEEKAA